jgi:hypothetical protein
MSVTVAERRQHGGAAKVDDVDCGSRIGQLLRLRAIDYQPVTNPQL